MIVIFDRAYGETKIAINAFHVSRIVPLGHKSTIYITSGTWETVKGTLEEVVTKLNGFIINA